MKLKHYLIIGASLCICVCLLVRSCRVGSRANYYQGRADQALEELVQVEEAFEQLKKQDEELQQQKDKRITELEEQIVEDDRAIVAKDKELVSTRTALKEAGLYEGLVAQLDKEWAEKYASLEDKLAKKDEIILGWQEKFDSKVKLEVAGWVERDLAQKEAIMSLQKLSKVQATEIKTLKLKGKLWKWTAIAAGGKIAYDLVAGRS